MRVLAVFLMWLPFAAVAQDGVWPGLFNVTGVAPEDTLNIRAEPTARSEVIGTLLPQARGVEVTGISEDGKWARVNAGERMGWVSLAYLARVPRQDSGGTPAVTACFGTEPFWRLSLRSDGWWLSMPGEPDIRFDESWRGAASGRFEPYGVQFGPAGTAAGLVIRRAACTDGMSDRAYGLTGDFLVHRAETGQSPGPALLSGCCTLAN